MEDAAQTLRTQRNLRALNTEEEGTSLSDLPPGVYGFTWSPSFESTPLFAKKAYRNFEFHKLSDGTAALIGYVTSEHARQLSHGAAGQISVYPDAWKEAQQLVTVPLDRIVPLKRPPSREDGCPLALDLR